MSLASESSRVCSRPPLSTTQLAHSDRMPLTCRLQHQSYARVGLGSVTRLPRQLMLPTCLFLAVTVPPLIGSFSFLPRARSERSYLPSTQSLATDSRTGQNRTQGRNMTSCGVKWSSGPSSNTNGGTTAIISEMSQIRQRLCTESALSRYGADLD